MLTTETQCEYVVTIEYWRGKKAYVQVWREDRVVASEKCTRKMVRATIDTLIRTLEWGRNYQWSKNASFALKYGHLAPSMLEHHAVARRKSGT